jgi:P27 family predicted phage terminase small subunit
MTGRKPLASAVHEQSGAYAKNPQRRNKNEPKPSPGWPDMPEIVKLDQKASECWDRVCKNLDDMRVLTKAELDILTCYCLDWSQFCWLWEACKEGNVACYDDKGKAIVSPAANQIHKYADRLLKRQSELGLTPSARTRLHAPQKEEEDEFQQWMKRAMSSDN